MAIENFVSKSLGEWKSMRSSHSPAFQQFEQVISEIKIESLDISSAKVNDLISNRYSKHIENICSPFQIEWNAISEWKSDEDKGHYSGSSIFIPIPSTQTEGKILRSYGYTEPIKSISTYKFLNDETFIIYSQYEQTIAEERIWFISDHVRCRSSIIRSLQSMGILQISFCSEVRKLLKTKS